MTEMFLPFNEFNLLLVLTAIQQENSIFGK